MESPSSLLLPSHHKACITQWKCHHLWIRADIVAWIGRINLSKVGVMSLPFDEFDFVHMLRHELVRHWEHYLEQTTAPTLCEQVNTPVGLMELEKLDQWYSTWVGTRDMCPRRAFSSASVKSELNKSSSPILTVSDRYLSLPQYTNIIKFLNMNLDTWC